MNKSRQKIKLVAITSILLLALIAVAGATLILGITMQKAQHNIESFNSDPIASYEKTYCEELMSYKLDQNYICTLTKEVYDFSGNANYMLCYDENLNWYAIINRTSGDVLERKESKSPYNDYLEYKCFYLGYGNYYFLEGNRIVSIMDTTTIFEADDIPQELIEGSINLNNKAITDGTFKSREEIEEFVKEQEKSIVSLCGASNRNNTHYCDNLLYFLEMCNALVPKRFVISTEPYYVTIGCGTFTRYNGAQYDDILFAKNTTGTCGIVSSAMLLQYYERNGILNVIPNSIYNNSIISFPSGSTVSSVGLEYTVAQKVHNAINAHHSEILGGSTYVSAKDAINGYFSTYGITGVSASSNVLDAGMKSTINNGDPVVVFISGGTGYSAYIDSSSNNYYSEYISSHAMLAFGYTTGLFGLVDEYICNKGWPEAYNNYYTYGVTYISHISIVGNVKLLY
ncbi:MAG: hypothetical protein E7338_02235 [Clostridiales bacterium]|nr:hypothetical protein [Clostridiales bacterium]